MRFFAASLVVITHIELIKDSLGLKNYWKEPVIFEAGSLGVYFFFVLSGFLITYILLKEKRTKGKISFKNFYLKRILRIWPLYYFVFLIGFLVLPLISWFNLPYFTEHFNNNYWFNFSFYALILPNVPYSVVPAVPHIGQSWSIGVEEQFYFFWPFLIAYFRKPFVTIILFTLLFVLFKGGIVLLGPELVPESIFSFLKKFFAMNKFELMSIGALGAWLVFSDSKLLNVIHNRFLAVASLASIPLLIFYTPTVIQDGIHLVYGILFLFLILHFSLAKKPLIDIEVQSLSYLGTISYGIYMYHLIVVFALVKIMSQFGMIENLFHNFLLYVGSFSISIAISAISYRYIEKPFLMIKEKKIS